MPLSLVYVSLILFSLFFAVKRFDSFGWGTISCIFWALIVLSVIFARDLYIKYFLVLLEKISFPIAAHFNLFVEDINSNEYCDSEVIEK